MKYRFELLTIKHQKSVINIFNYFVKNTFAAYPIIQAKKDFFDNLMEMSIDYLAVVIKADGNKIVGFAALWSYGCRMTFNETAELFYFILPEHSRKGLGKTILDRFAKEARRRGIYNLLVNISSKNHQSVAFHRKYGFKECGRLQKIGKKFGKSFDVIWMQKKLRRERNMLTS
jgi:L-amino acid N-acyltransferase YncA